MKPKQTLPLEVVRSRVVGIRMTDADFAMVKADADSLGLTVSSYLMHNALRRPVDARARISIVNELRRQGGLLKLLASTYRTSNDLLPDLKAAIAQTQAAIKLAGESV